MASDEERWKTMLRISSLCYSLAEREVNGVDGGEVVLKVTTHVGVVQDGGDACLLQVPARPHARTHQELWGLQRPRRQDHLLAHAHRAVAARAVVLHGHGLLGPRVDDHPPHRGQGLHHQVRTQAPDREDEGPAEDKAFISYGSKTDKRRKRIHLDQAAKVF